MKIRAHCSGKLSPELYRKLSETIKLDDIKRNGITDHSVFDIDSDHPLYEECTQKIYSVKRLIFNEQERNSATWLTVRTTNLKLEAEEIEKTFNSRCPYFIKQPWGNVQNYYHFDQIAPFSFRKPIKWGNNHFYSCWFMGFGVIFCDLFAKQVIEESGLRGVEFVPVMQYKSKIPLDNIFQIKATFILANDYLVIDQSFLKGKCPVCGEVWYEQNGTSRLIVKSDSLPDLDFCSTNSIFKGEPINLASARFYQILKEAGITRNLMFEPLLLC